MGCSGRVVKNGYERITWISALMRAMCATSWVVVFISYAQNKDGLD